MEKGSRTAYLILIALLGSTALVLVLLDEASVASTASIRTELPAQIGQWTGLPVLYCQNGECKTPLPEDGGVSGPVCTTCGSEADAMSPGEKLLLPSDTRIMRKVYTSREGNRIVVSIVFMGADRTSIHRPQMCLEGQGYRIMKHRFVSLPLKEPDQCSVALLDLVRSVARPNGGIGQQAFAYAYWYAGGNRKTASFLRMQVWMAIDRLFRNRADQWAYASLFMSVDDDSDAYIEDLRQFGASLWPLISRSP